MQNPFKKPQRPSMMDMGMALYYHLKDNGHDLDIDHISEAISMAARKLLAREEYAFAFDASAAAYATTYDRFVEGLEKANFNGSIDLAAHALTRKALLDGKDFT